MYISKKAAEITSSPTLEMDAKYKAMKAQGISVICFGAGEPDFDTPDSVKESAIEAIRLGHTKYTPVSGISELKEAICGKLKRDNNLNYTADEIVVSNGAKHSLYNAIMAICDPGDEVILHAPYWVSYPEMVKMVGAKPVIIETAQENNFKLTPDQFKNAITSKTRAIVLNSPNNPTGMVYTKSELYEIADIALQNNVYVISDEIYEKLVYGIEHVSIASLDKFKSNVIVVNGISKAYAMTGWRIGYTASDKKIASTMSNIQSHTTSNPNSIAQYAALSALTGDQSVVKSMKEEYLKRRDYMLERISVMDKVSCVKPDGAFYMLLNIKNLLDNEFYGQFIRDSSQLSQSMLEHARVAVVPSIGFGIQGYVRLSYSVSLGEIEEGMNRIEHYIERGFKE